MLKRRLITSATAVDKHAMYPHLLSFKQYRHLKISALLAFIFTVLYCTQSTIEPASGGSTLGYLLGIFSTLLLLILLFLGIRKRSFELQWGSMQGWLSAHIYLGCLMIYTATLHTGFQWGWNIHGLSYALLCMVSISGFFGIYSYLVFPQQLGEEFLQQEKLQRVQEIDQETMQISNQLSRDSDKKIQFYQTIQLNLYSAINHCQLGGGILHQLSGYDLSKRQIFEENDILELQDNHSQESISTFISQQLSHCQAHEQDKDEINRLQRLLSLTAEKCQLLNHLRKEIRTKALLQLWLYFHIPLSITLLIAVSLHIVSVFLYW